MGLWGDEFITVKEEKKKAKKTVDKVNKPKKNVKEVTEKSIKSKQIPLKDKIEFIKRNVYAKLGKFADNTVCLRTVDQYNAYIDAAISNGAIAIDTETNNSLDPITCLIMGACIYTPGQKNAYVPVHHINPDTNELLPMQLTEQQIREGFQRLVDNNVFIIMHNGKFDYAVIKCTCGICLPIHWDTLIGAKLLNENEDARLKVQYISKIDSSIEKYNIEKLFEGLPYEIFDPELFALYAATDAFMTYKLYEYQLNIFMRAENTRLFNLFKNIEMPLVVVISEMEMAGMEVDQDYARLLSATYHEMLDNVDNRIEVELVKIKPVIDKWRTTPEANVHPPKKKGEGFAKSANEQLTDPINLASPTQLAILFYDIFKCNNGSKKSPRGTGEEELNYIADHYELPICKLLIERRGVAKILTTYVDSIPELAKRWPDGRVRTHFNQYGAATGRLSSSDPLNFQNIPSHEKRIRMLFKAKVVDKPIEITDDYYDVPIINKVETKYEWKYPENLQIGDIVICEDEEYSIKNIIKFDNSYRIYV